MSSERTRDLLAGLGFVVLQLILFRHLEIFNARADIVLLFLIWYMAFRSRTAAIVMAALLGFTQDALMDLWGLHMFSKTLTVFVIYNFLPKSRESQLRAGQVFITVILISLIHNLLFLGLSSLSGLYSAELVFWEQLLGNSLYTAAVGSLVHLFRTS